MKIERLDHVNIQTKDLAAMVDWYQSRLGLHQGYRPAFGNVGAWLYARDDAIVHISEVEPAALTGSEVPLKLEHFALRASGDADEFERRLMSLGEAYKRFDLAEIRTAAFNVWDPDGNHIHVDLTVAG